MQAQSQSTLTQCLKDALMRVISGGPAYLFFLCAFCVLFIVGVFTGVHSTFIEGSRHAYGTYREIPLGLLISTYMYFVVASTGLCFISAIGYVFGIRSFLPIARRLVLLALITLIAGFIVIGMEIENPLRMGIYLFTSANFTSNIWWMGVLYSFYMVFVALAFICLMRSSYRAAAVAGLLSVCCGLAAIGVEGGIFAMLHGRDVWYGPYLPIYILVAALMSGCAFAIFFGILAYRISGVEMEPGVENALAKIRKLAMLMIAAIAYLTVWKMLPMAVGGDTRVITLQEMLSGSHAASFWGWEVLCVMLIPFVLFYLSGGKKQLLMLVASGFMITGIFFMRVDMVVMGQIVPLYWDMGVKEYSHLLHYSPTWKEALVALSGFGFCLAAFLLAEKIFNGFSDDCKTGTVEQRKAERES